MYFRNLFRFVQLVSYYKARKIICKPTSNNKAGETLKNGFKPP